MKSAFALLAEFTALEKGVYSVYIYVDVKQFLCCSVQKWHIVCTLIATYVASNVHKKFLYEQYFSILRKSNRNIISIDNIMYLDL